MGKLAQDGDLIPGRPGGVCGIARIWDGLDTEDRAVLLAWLTDPAAQHASISVRLREAGHDVGADTVRRHRGRKCKCPGEHPEFYDG